MFKVTSRDGTSIAVEAAGEGPAIVCVGGAMQVLANPRWARMAELLGDRFTVVAYDRRGRGDSTDTAPYSVQREVEDLDAVIESVGGSAAVVGMSSGAVLALDAAAAGSAITHLALYEPPFVVDESRPPVPEDYLASLRDHLDRGDREAAVEYFVTRTVGVPGDFAAAMRQSPFWPAMVSVAHTLPYDGAIMADTMSGRPLPAGRWASIDLPILVLSGGESDAWLQSGAKAIADVLPTAGHRTLNGQTHDVDSAVLTEALGEFLSA